MRAFRWFRRKLREIKDHDENRDLVGKDRYGNKYYQYYSYLGLPTKREIEFVDKDRLQPFEDKAFFWWMKRQSDHPPTPLELKEYYREEKERKARAIAHNKESQRLDLEYYERKSLEKKIWPEGLSPNVEEFEPKKWEPVSKRRGSLHDLSSKSNKWGIK